jgi:hypothetical protein
MKLASNKPKKIGKTLKKTIKDKEFRIDATSSGD